MESIKAATLAELYLHAAETHGPRAAFATKLARGHWRPLTFSALLERSQALATALIECGLSFQGRLGILADNSEQWIMVDWATQLAGACNVPRGTDIADRELAGIFRHAELEAIAVADHRQLARLIHLAKESLGFQQVVLMNEAGLSDSLREQAKAADLRIRTLPELIRQGGELRRAGDRRVEERIKQLRPDDLFTLIYTTGTTGSPKGVMLSHRNVLSQVRGLPFKLGVDERFLSMLPIWHVYERIFEIVAISQGVCTWYSSPKSLADDLRAVRPTIMASAPRLWQSLYDRIQTRVAKAHPLRRSLFNWAMRFAGWQRRSRRILLGNDLQDTPLLPRLRSCLRRAAHLLRIVVTYIPFGILNAGVLEQTRIALGGAFRGSISGGGALQPHVDAFFNDLGIPVLEGYGLTETSPVVAVRTFEKVVLGTVGPPFPGTEIRIVDLDSGEVLYPNFAKPFGGFGLRGEIQVRGPQVMLGYFRDEALTRQVIDEEGWFKTGDIGSMSSNLCLRVLGRCKDTIVLLSGENIEPAPIEAALAGSPLIEAAVVVGQDQKHLGALIVPAPEGFAVQKGEQRSYEDLAESPEVQTAIRDELRKLVSVAGGFRKFEHIVGFELLPAPFKEGVEVTVGLLKPRRHQIHECFEERISRIFEKA